MFSFMNRLWSVGRGTRSRSETQGNGQRTDNQSLESWQVQGMGKTPRDLNVARGTMGMGDPGSYLFGKGTGQQGTETGFGFAPPVFQNQGLGQATESGAAKTGAPGLWASPTMGTGMSGFDLFPLATGNQGFGPTNASGTTASESPDQWANLTTGTEISGFGLAQLASGRGTTGHRDGLWFCPTSISKSRPRSGYCVGCSGNRSPGYMD